MNFIKSNFSVPQYKLKESMQKKQAQIIEKKGKQNTKK